MPRLSVSKRDRPAAERGEGGDMAAGGEAMASGAFIGNVEARLGATGGLSGELGASDAVLCRRVGRARECQLG